MEIFVFGNQDIPQDSLPLKILPALKKRFPEIQFRVLDPNEDWDVPEELLVIDTAEGIDRITVFDNLDRFASSPRVTMHDFDALANLRLLQKLGKLKKIKIIGVPAGKAGGPPTISEAEVIQGIVKLLSSQLSKSE